MAASEGKSIRVRTEGLDKNGLLGNAQLKGGSAPASVADVERIVATVRDCFVRFTQQQLTYAASVATSTASSEQAINEIARTGGGGGSKQDTVKIAAIDKRTHSWERTMDALSRALPAITAANQSASRATAASRTSSGGAGIMKNLMGVIMGAFKAIVSSPVFVFGLVLAGTMVYKFLIKPWLDKGFKWKDALKNAWSNTMKPYLIDFYQKHIKPMIDTVVPYFNQFKDWCKEAWPKVTGFVSNNWPKVEEFFKETFPKVWDFCKEYGEKLWNWAQSIDWAGIWEKVKSAWNTVSTFVSNVISGIEVLSDIGAMKEQIYEWTEDGINWAVDWVKEKFEELVGAVKEFFDGVVESIKNILKKIPGYETAKKAVGKVKGWLGFGKKKKDEGDGKSNDGSKDGKGKKVDVDKALDGKRKADDKRLAEHDKKQRETNRRADDDAHGNGGKDGKKLLKSVEGDGTGGNGGGEKSAGAKFVDKAKGAFSKMRENGRRKKKEREAREAKAASNGAAASSEDFKKLEKTLETIRGGQLTADTLKSAMADVMNPKFDELASKVSVTVPPSTEMIPRRSV